AKKVPRAETQASVRLETEMTAETREGAGEREPPERSLDLEPATAPALEPASGWEVTPFYTPGAPEQIEGHYRQDGKIVARLYGVAGVYAPEPPPGLQGFVWDNGYWVYVQRQETDP
ncbi:MAG: hypothetical protein FWF69_02275, partial [Firmicutes bacterium]|nr:hypothetical protein [Bacillota bacterium]